MNRAELFNSICKDFLTLLENSNFNIKDSVLIVNHILANVINIRQEQIENFHTFMFDQIRDYLLEIKTKNKG